MQKLMFVLWVAILGSFCAIAQSPTKISTADFKPVFGNWEGSLTYLDYSSGKPFSMPANIAISRLGSKQLIFANAYPEETGANAVDTSTIAKNGTLLDEEKLISKRKLEDGNLEIITEYTGPDGNDNLLARIRHTYIIGKTLFVRRKDVMFVGDAEWIMRHEFRYNKRINSPQK
jgi:hypothetical protein